MAAGWEKIGDRLYISERTVRYVSTYTGKASNHEICLRIDGRRGPYRVDLLGPVIPIPEAIDGGTGYDTLAEAQRYARAWLAAAEAQGTLTPRVER
jgi:hypothetical protein